MGLLLSERELAELEPAEKAAFHSPVPTQIVSNREFVPLPQTPQQRKVAARIEELADAARLYKPDPGISIEPLRHDHIGSMKQAYLENGPTRNNMAYGYVNSITQAG